LVLGEGTKAEKDLRGFGKRFLAHRPKANLGKETGPETAKKGRTEFNSAAPLKGRDASNGSEENR